MALGLGYGTDLLDSANFGALGEFRQYFEEIREFLPSLANRVAGRDALTVLFVTLLGMCRDAFSGDEVYAQSLRIFTQKTPEDLQTQKVLNGLGNDTPAMLFYVLADRERLKFRVTDYQDTSLSLSLAGTRGLFWLDGSA